MVELRTYDSDADDVAELCERVRMHDGDDDKWTPLWDAPFVRQQIEAPADDRELMIGAYDDGRLIGSFFAIPYLFNVGVEQLRGTFSTCFMVDPAYRALGPYLIEKLRRRHRDLEYAFSLGFVMGGPATTSFQCWSNYAKHSPHNCTFVSDAGCWFAALDPALLDNSVSEDEQRRMDAYLAGQSRARESSRSNDVNIRVYRDDDLVACLECLMAQIESADWTIHWNEKSLCAQLQDNGHGQTLVAEREGKVCGFISHHRLSLWNGAKIRSAVIDLLAAISGDRSVHKQLVAAACRKLSKEDVQVAMALRSPTFRARTMIPSGFLPLPEPNRLVMLFADQDRYVSPSGNFEIILR